MKLNGYQETRGHCSGHWLSQCMLHGSGMRMQEASILRVSQGAKLRFTNPITHITPLPAVPGWIRQIHHLLQDRILVV